MSKVNSSLQSRWNFFSRSRKTPSCTLDISLSPLTSSKYIGNRIYVNNRSHQRKDLQVGLSISCIKMLQSLQCELLLLISFLFSFHLSRYPGFITLASSMKMEMVKLLINKSSRRIMKFSAFMIIIVTA